MATTKATLLGHRSATSFSDLTLSGDLTVNGTTTTLDTAVQNVDKLEIGANSDDYGAQISQAGTGAGLKINNTSTGNILQLQDGGTDVMVVKDGGNVGIGAATPSYQVDIQDTGSSGTQLRVETTADVPAGIRLESGNSGSSQIYFGDQADNDVGRIIYNHDGDYLGFNVNASERMRILSNGNVLFGTTNASPAEGTGSGTRIGENGGCQFSTTGSTVQRVNRGSSDGTLVAFCHEGTIEGEIYIAGTTVSYNGGHLSRWSYLPSKQKDDSFLKGTVLTNLDAMCEWEKDTGEKKNNEQLNQVNISTVEGDPNVAGVFVNWCDFDEAQYKNTHDFIMAMTGDMIIRIANGVTVEKGQLLMSAGDGTAKPQGDDIVKNKTIAKVTSNHVTCIYDDGSFCVPCVLMAC